MKKVLRSVLFGWILIVFGCNQKYSEGNIEETPQNDVIAAGTTYDEAHFAQEWVKFRKGVLENEPDFDWLKIIDNDLLNEFEENDIVAMFEESYTLQYLEDFDSYDKLDKKVESGISYRIFPVIVASSDMIAGYVYWFKEDMFLGQLVLSKIMPYEEP
jgi:hypothetical protein